MNSGAMNTVVHVSFRIIVLYGYVPRSGMAGSYCNSISILFIFLKKFIYLFVYFWLHWVFIAVRGLSLVAASRGYSSLQCTGLSLAV